MYEKNSESVTHLNLSILLTVFLNKAVISLLTFSFSSDSEKKSLSLCYSLLSLMAKSYNPNGKSMIWVKDEWM